MALGVFEKLFGGSEQQGASLDPTQKGFLDDLFARASAASQLTGGQQFSQGFQNPSFQGFNSLINGQPIAGTESLEAIANGSVQNTNLQGEIDSGLNDISRNFNQNILPSLNTNAGLTGGSGGSRQGIAKA